jgi:hypothetical protein
VQKVRNREAVRDFLVLQVLENDADRCSHGHSLVYLVSIAQFEASYRYVRAVNLGTPEYQGSRHFGSVVPGTLIAATGQIGE